MSKQGRLWRAGAIAIMPIMALGLSACSLPGSSDVAASPKPTPVPTRVSHVSNSTSGTWVFKDAHTNEVLRLHQDKHGAVSGDGDAAVRVGNGKTDHSSIDVHSGQLKNGKLTLSLYVAQIDWGSGLTIVENLRCGATPHVLHCLMDAPLYANVRNVPQDFVRRA